MAEAIIADHPEPIADPPAIDGVIPLLARILQWLEDNRDEIAARDYPTGEIERVSLELTGATMQLLRRLDRDLAVDRACRRAAQLCRIGYEAG